MKGSITITDTIGIIIIALLLITLFTSIFFKIFDEIARELASSSADGMARRLSNLMTISGAAPYYVKIKLEEKARYNCEVKSSRYIWIQLSNPPGYRERTGRERGFALPFSPGKYEDVSVFTITKRRNGGVGYGFKAK